MANASLRTTSNLLSKLPHRFASTAAATTQKHDVEAARPQVVSKSEPLQVTKLPNGITVASIENYSPITRVAAVLNVGARDELYAEKGACHALRTFSNLATKNYSTFGLTRTLDQHGADFGVTSSREKTTYLLESTRNKMATCIDAIGDVLSKPEFRQWELDDTHARFDFDLNVYDAKPELRLSDLIHRAAFRNGLSNSLYAPRASHHHLMSHDFLADFHARHYTSDRLTLIGTGISHDDMLRHAEFFRLPKGTAPLAREQAKYHASELREDNLDELVHIALAMEGVSASSKDALVSGIVSSAFGNAGPRVKYSMGSSHISKSVLPLASHPALVNSFNANYTDTGLFGFQIVANKNDAGKLVQGVYKDLAKTAKNGLNSAEVQIAKSTYKASLLMAFESNRNVIDNIDINMKHANFTELMSSIDAVSVTDVNTFIKRLAAGKSSMAAIGNLSELPRVEDLVA